MKDSGHAFTDIINTLLLLVRYPANLSDDRKKQHAPHIRFFMDELKDGINDRESTYDCITNLWVYMKNVWKDLSEEDTGEDEAHDKATEKADEYMEEILGDYKDMGLPLPPEGKQEKMRKSVYTSEFERMMRDHKSGKDEGMSKAIYDSDAKLASYEELMEGLSSRMINAINELAESDYKEIHIDKSNAISKSQSKI